MLLYLTVFSVDVSISGVCVCVGASLIITGFGVFFILSNFSNLFMRSCGF